MKILVAGTAELSRQARQSFLERSEYEFVICTGGREALELAMKERPDLIILGDVTDPGPIDCWRRLQAAESTATLPVMLILDEAERSLAPAGAEQAGIDEPDGIVSLAGRLLSVRRRAHRRRPLKVRVDFYGPDLEGVGHARDLSESGMFLSSDEALLPGDRLQLIFGLPAPDQPVIRAGAEVVRRQLPSSDDAQRQGGLGIRFRTIGERDLRAIKSLIHPQGQDPS